MKKIFINIYKFKDYSSELKKNTKNFITLNNKNIIFKLIYSILNI